MFQDRHARQSQTRVGKKLLTQDFQETGAASDQEIVVRTIATEPGIGE